MGWHYLITEEMREVFNDKEVDVFAVVYGFSQEGQGCFYGSLATLCRYCGIKSKTTAMRILKDFVARKVLEKKEVVKDGVKFCSYQISPDWYEKAKGGISMVDMGISMVDMGGISMVDNNNQIINNQFIERDSKGTSGRFVKPSIEEIAAYCRERKNGIDAEEFFAHYDSNGWMVGKVKMKSWRAAVITWEKKRKNERGPRGVRQGKKESAFEHNMKVADALFGTDLHNQIYGGNYDEQ